jgi:hypothetical protein
MKLYKNSVWKMVCTWNKNYKGVCRDAFKADGGCQKKLCTVWMIHLEPRGTIILRLILGWVPCSSRKIVVTLA